MTDRFAFDDTSDGDNPLDDILEEIELDAIVSSLTPEDRDAIFGDDESLESIRRDIHAVLQEEAAVRRAKQMCLQQQRQRAWDVRHPPRMHKLIPAEELPRREI